MSAAVYILDAVVAVLLIALVLCWMLLRRKASSDTTITVEVEMTGADAVSAHLDALTAKAAHLADMLARAKRDAGLIALPVRTGQEPPKRLPPSPPPAPAKKRRTR